MRRAVVILSLSTVAFAASTAYLARELYFRDGDRAPAAIVDADNDARPGVSPVLRSETRADAASAPANAAVPPTVDSAKPGVAASAATPNPKPDEQADAGTMFARQLLARFDDLTQRPALLEEMRSVIRRQYARLKENLKLSDSTFEQLATLLAEEQLQWQEHWARCAADPKCDANDSSRGNPYVDHSEELRAMLGSDGLEALTEFRSSIGERDAVIQLRGRLPDSNFLPEAQAEKLIAALADERAQYQREATARGAKVRAWGTQLGMLMFSEDSGQADQYVIEATQYSQRLRARAAGVLTSAQLAAYDQMQQELLTQLAAYLRPPARQNKSAGGRST